MLEAKKHLGGRAHSFYDKTAGMEIDNCQHVLLGCCSAAKDFLTKIGSFGRVKFYEDIRLVDSDKRSLAVRVSHLPAPVHLLPSVLSTRYFSLDEKLELTRVFARVGRTHVKPDETAAGYLKRIGCSHRLMARLLDPVIIAALNEPSSDASAVYARMVMTESLTKSRYGHKMGIPNGPLSQIISGPAERYLARRGCRIRKSSRVERLCFSGGRVDSVVLVGGERIRADYFVSAVTPDSLHKMGFSTDAAFAMKWRPIKSVHLFYEGLPSFERVCAVGEPFGWIFNKTREFELGFGYVQAVASAAESLNDLSSGDIIELAGRAVNKAAGFESGLKKAIIFNAKRATFATTGVDEIRPSSETGIRNLFLAGDWTATGWPSTIESAVRSGMIAANLILSKQERKIG